MLQWPSTYIYKSQQSPSKNIAAAVTRSIIWDCIPITSIKRVPRDPMSLRRVFHFLNARFLIPTLKLSGFLKNPSLVSRSPSCLNSQSQPLKTVATISASSISATLRPTHARGPVLNGINAPFCCSVRFSGANRSGRYRSASGPQISLE